MSGTFSQRAGLIGRGIGASASPAIHMREAEAQGLSLSYELIDFDALGLPDSALGERLDHVAQLGFRGVNITHPFKQAVIDLLDEVEPTASALGAVNCVAFENGRKVGFNSDWQGFRFLLETDLPDASLDCVAQIGAGGAGSATAYALLSCGARELRICDKSAERRTQLLDRLAKAFPQAHLSACDDAAEALDGADGVVQATPVGMASHPGVPFDPQLLSDNQWLADIVYFPRQTELVLAAKERGLAAVGGSAMVIGQAAQPFGRFTGFVPDTARMLDAFLSNDAAMLRRAAG